jgi:hypothetical protein
VIVSFLTGKTGPSSSPYLLAVRPGTTYHKAPILFHHIAFLFLEIALPNG